MSKSNTEHISIDELTDLLHRLRGSRQILVEDHLPEDVRESVEAKGEVTAYTKLLHLINEYEQEEQLPDQLNTESWDELARLSRARRDFEVTYQDEMDDPPEVGVQ